eukprot:gene4381-6196_t
MSTFPRSNSLRETIPTNFRDIGKNSLNENKCTNDSNCCGIPPDSPTRSNRNKGKNNGGYSSNPSSPSRKQHLHRSRRRHIKNFKNLNSLNGMESLNMMKSLSFETIDLLNTPLSSLKSCSEYYQKQKTINSNNMNNIIGSDNSLNHDNGSSYWSRFMNWSIFSSSNNKSRSRNNSKQRISFAANNIDEQSFLVNNLRFNEANLYEDEDYNYSPGNQSGQIIRSSDSSAGCLGFVQPLFSGEPNKTQTHRPFHNSNNQSSQESTERRVSNSSLFRSFLFSHDCVTSPLLTNNQHIHDNHERYNSHHKQNYPDDDYSIMHDSTIALDMLFGIKPGGTRKNLPMEIELKTLKEPQYIYSYNENTSNNSMHHYHEMDSIEMDSPHNHIPSPTSTEMRRVTSFLTLERINDNNSTDFVNNSTQLQNNNSDIQNKVTLWNEILVQLSNSHQISIMTSYLREQLVDRDDETFYDALRLQPFSSGAYLRAFVLSGLFNLLLLGYNVVSWPAIEGLTPPQQVIKCILYYSLMVQAVPQVLQLPIRIKIQYECWNSSRAVEVHQASGIIRTMIRSDYWLYNRAFGRIIDGLAIIHLILSEFYLTITPSNDPLRVLMVSLCASNALTFVFRLLTAVLFSVSLHDPNVLSEARKRGLSKWDLQSLPTFVYTNPAEVVNTECSICLGSFDMGEMLISLPCDNKHSFHAGCIRQWLQRQNSCPLCQKLV